MSTNAFKRSPEPGSCISCRSKAHIRGSRNYIFSACQTHLRVIHTRILASIIRCVYSWAVTTMHAAQYKGGTIMLKRSLHLLGVVALAILLSGIVGVGQASASSPIKEEKGAKVSVVIVAKSAGADASTLVYD